MMVLFLMKWYTPKCLGLVKRDNPLQHAMSTLTSEVVKLTTSQMAT